MSDDTKLVNFRAPRETVKQAKDKLEHGEMSKLLRQRLKEVAHGADVAEQSRLKDRLNGLREQKKEIQKEIDDLRHERDQVETKIERVEERLDALLEQDGEYDGFLQGLDQDLQDGKSLFKGHPKVQRASELGRCSQAEVLDDLRERNPDVPEEQFTEAITH